MAFRKSTLATVAQILLVAAALANVRLLRHVGQYCDPTLKPDSVSVYRQRYQGLKAVIPENLVLGYIADERPAPECHTAFSLTRYVLAPIRTVRDARLPLVVANFQEPAMEPGGPGASGLVLLRDFENGVKLYRRKAEQ